MRVDSYQKRWYRIDKRPVGYSGFTVGPWFWGTYWDAQKRQFADWGFQGVQQIRTWSYADNRSHLVTKAGAGTGDVGAVDLATFLRRAARPDVGDAEDELAAAAARQAGPVSTGALLAGVAVAAIGYFVLKDTGVIR